jgi:hypothetical protein
VFKAVVKNGMAARPGSPKKWNNGLNHRAIASIMPQYCSNLTANEMGSINLSNQRDVFSVGGKAFLAAIEAVWKLFMNQIFLFHMQR